MTLRRCRVSSWILGLVAVVVVGPPAALPAEGGRLELGLRANVMGADGEPTNDQLGAGIVGRYRLNDRWSLGASLDRATGFDVELPARFLGLDADPAVGEIDASATATQVLVWMERRYGRRESRLEWFWGLGAGAVTTDVDPVSGPLVGGGSFDIVQDVGTELVAASLAGLRVRLGRAWLLEAALRADQHFTDWTIRDRVSGAAGEFDDYLVRGISLGVGYRF